MEIVEKINIPDSLLVRQTESNVPVMETSVSFVGDFEAGAYVCAAENDTLKLQINGLLDILEKHIGAADAVKPDPTAGEETPARRKRWWDPFD